MLMDAQPASSATPRRPGPPTPAMPVPARPTALRRAGHYDDLDGLPDAALQVSLGCGNPVAVADLGPGETVLDLGSGGGIDVLLSARRAQRVRLRDRRHVEMVDLARRNAAHAAVTNVEFLHGTIEAVPLPDASVDVVISNCVIVLSVDKDATFDEIARSSVPADGSGSATSCAPAPTIPPPPA